MVYQIFLVIKHATEQLASGVSSSFQEIASFVGSLPIAERFFLGASLTLVITSGLGLVGLFYWRSRRLAQIKTQEEQQRRVEAEKWAREQYELERRQRQEQEQRAKDLYEFERQQRQAQEQRVKDLHFQRVSQMSRIKEMEPLELEQYVAELFQRMGYQTTLTPKFGDHGVDAQLTSPHGEKGIVQCKQWPSREVGEPALRDFYGTMVAEDAVQGYFVAPHGFTQQARTWAMRKPIVLADAHWLYMKASELDLKVDETQAQAHRVCTQRLSGKMSLR